VEEAAIRRPGDLLRLSIALPAWARPGDRAWLAVRPEDVYLAARDGTAGGGLMGTVRERTYLGNLVDYQVEASSLTLRIQAHHAALFEVGAPVALRVDAERCTLIPRD
jgi:ABC-type Fe3+/spermidine/putrescine transport system ATPase subunit